MDRLTTAQYELAQHIEYTPEQVEAFKVVHALKEKQRSLIDAVKDAQREAYGMRDEEKYFCLEHDGSIVSYSWSYSSRDMAGADRGNAFRTEEEAKAEDERRLAAVAEARGISSPNSARRPSPPRITPAKERIDRWKT